MSVICQRPVVDCPLRSDQPLSNVAKGERREHFEAALIRSINPSQNKVHSAVAHENTEHADNLRAAELFFFDRRAGQW
jgi:hypothetical protein